MSHSASTGDDSTASDSPDLEMVEAPKTVSMVTGDELDIRSCVQLLLDLFTQFVSPSPEIATPPALLCQVMRSMVAVTDVLDQAPHYEWLLHNLLQVDKLRPVDDELVRQYLAIGACKAACFSGQFEMRQEKLISLIDNGLQSSHVPSRAAALHASVFLLQSAPNNSAAIDKTYEDKTALGLYLCLINGFERLILSGCLSTSQITAVVKLSINKLLMQNVQRSLHAVRLLLACMHFGTRGAESSITEIDVEMSIVTMERITVIFDRIRKSAFAEAKVLCRILPRLLIEFCSPDDVMNKVIGEFISNQQPHPQLLAKVLSEVFSKLINDEKADVVVNWLMLSLSNLAQRTPLSMAIWSLTVCFVSASQSNQLRAL
ncbi:DgyrCDS5598 [Dimorphilus gyrociliatus]|uniref:DgyrCDS5598 n=1 Tax=Dimorphilus gyrociliatus TaxID=2664684 RepID=A0A7I8VLY8_9ANNE|nr:DgyrCDS5598 [Dimorphilus gyrociliatus]